MMPGISLDWPVIAGVAILAVIVITDTVGLIRERRRDRRGSL
ncbi:hypothetical protein [Aeromicrobium sp. 179-A 4D2 NHS]